MYTTGLYKIVDKILNTFSDEGFRQLTYGTDKDLDLSKRQSNYPLTHLVFTNLNHSSTATILNFSIIVADKLDKTPSDPHIQTNIETQNEVVGAKYGGTNILDIQQNLLIKSQTAINNITKRFISSYDSLNIGYGIQYPVSYNVFYEDYPELLSGYVISLSVELPNMTEYVCD